MSCRIRRTLLAILCVLAVVACFAQLRELRIALGSHWSDPLDPVRASLPITQTTMATLDLQDGQHVADIGAGSGFYSMRMAAEVGHEGRVTATEANPYSVLSLYLNRWRYGAQAIEPTLQAYDDLVPGGHFDRAQSATPARPGTGAEARWQGGHCS
jgi:predicted O-methyltransferase YrrM